MSAIIGMAILAAAIAAIGLAIRNAGKENTGFPASRRNKVAEKTGCRRRGYLSGAAKPRTWR